MCGPRHRRGPRSKIKKREVCMSLVGARGLIALCLTGAIFAGCSSDGGSSAGPAYSEIDQRCQTLCASSAPACQPEVSSCELECQSRIEGVSAVCAACLLEDAHGGPCAGGGPCCPRPEFSAVLSCADLCAGEVGVNPEGEHPMCAALCSSDEPACEDGVASCAQSCQGRIMGVSGLCATCLLEGAYGGPCAEGALCCPGRPEFPQGARDCAPLCLNGGG